MVRAEDLLGFGEALTVLPSFFFFFKKPLSISFAYSITTTRKFRSISKRF
jgi:hypothetical protein